jgi:hypothetical protein
MKAKFVYIVLILGSFFAGCEQKKIDTGKPVRLNEAIALFYGDAKKKIPKGSHVIVREKDIKSPGGASSVIQWQVMQNFLLREDIKVHDNDNINAQDIKGSGEIFTINIRLEEWKNTPYYKGFFSVKKDEVKANDLVILLKEYAIRVDEELQSLLKTQPKKDSTEAVSDDLSSEEEPQVEDSGTGFLKIINKSEEDNIIGLRVYNNKNKSLVAEKSVNIGYGGREQTYEFPSGEYRLEVKDDFNKKFCSVGAFKIKNEQTERKTYGGCK